MKKTIGIFLSASLLAALLIPAAALAEVTVSGGSSLTIEATGNKGTLSLTASCEEHGSASFKWYSSDNGTATVGEDTGFVQAESRGTCNITAFCSENAADYKTVTVTVMQETDVAVSGPAKIEKGKTAEYTASVQPSDAAGNYTWSVGTGLNIVSGQGTDKITVSGETAGDTFVKAAFKGSSYCTTSSSSRSVTVTEPAEPIPTSISFTTVPDSVNVGEQKTVKVEVTPYVEGNYVWTSGSALSILAGQNTPTIVVQGAAAGSSTLKVEFKPTDSGYKGCDVAKEISVKEVPKEPKLTVTASGTSFNAAGVVASVTSTITNPGAGTWSFSTQLASGDSVQLNSITPDGTVSFTTKSDGESVIQVNAKNETQGKTLKATVKITVSLPQPYLTLTADRTTLNSSHTSTKVHANLYNANAEVPSNARIYWYSSDTSVAKITASAKYLSGSYANATVSARGNGSAIITARTANGHVVDTVRIIVENYKAIPQTGPRMWMIFAEAAVMLGLVAAAGALYYGKKKQRN